MVSTHNTLKLGHMKDIVNGYVSRQVEEPRKFEHKVGALEIPDRPQQKYALNGADQPASSCVA